MQPTPIQIRPATVKLIDQFLKPFSNEGILTVAEHREVVAQLRHISSNGTPIPPVEPRLIDQRQAAELLGISPANFKKLEPTFPFRRLKIGASVRYRNLDVIRFIMDDASEA